MSDVTPAPDATPRPFREGSHNSDLHSLESAWIRDYFAERLQEVHRMFAERDLRYEQRFTATANMVASKEQAYTQQVQQTAEALRIQTAAADDNLLAHILAQKESVKLALDSLNALLAEREKALTKAREEQRESEVRQGAALDLRLEGMNQFRRQIESERTDYVRRDSHQQTISDMDRRIEGQFAVLTASMADRDHRLDERHADNLATRTAMFAAERKQTDERLAGVMQRADDRISVLTLRLEKADEDRQRLRDDLSALTVRQATEDRGQERGLAKFDSNMAVFIGLGLILVSVISLLAGHHII